MFGVWFGSVCLKQKILVIFLVSHFFLFVGAVSVLLSTFHLRFGSARLLTSIRYIYTLFRVHSHSPVAISIFSFFFVLQRRHIKSTEFTRFYFSPSFWLTNIKVTSEKSAKKHRPKIEKYEQLFRECTSEFLVFSSLKNCKTSKNTWDRDVFMVAVPRVLRSKFMQIIFFEIKHIEQNTQRWGDSFCFILFQFVHLVCVRVSVRCTFMSCILCVPFEFVPLC